MRTTLSTTYVTVATLLPWWCLADSSRGVVVDWRGATTMDPLNPSLEPPPQQDSTCNNKDSSSKPNNNNMNHHLPRRNREGNHSLSHVNVHAPSVVITRDDDDDATTSTTTLCGVYLAPSTIPGAGMGTFAGKPYTVGEEVTPGDAVVPLRDMAWHNGGEEFTNTFLWDEYIWQGETFVGMTEPAHHIDGASFGIGAAPNCFFPLLNVEDSHVLQRDYAGLPRSSPGVGAFTPWYDRRSHATQDIEAGSELFVDYGYSYFQSREATIGPIPFLEDYEIADEILKRYTRLSQSVIRGSVWKKCIASYDTAAERQAHCQISVLGETNQPLKSDLYRLTRSVLGAWRDSATTRIHMALPEDAAVVPFLMENGGAGLKDYKRSVRDVEYLEKHGTCMDHLVVKPSTVAVAGRGAFAKRDLPVGSTVAPLPLIHIPDRSVVNMYVSGSEIDPETGEYQRDLTQLAHYQLILNYCFGHRDTTLLLCPYGVVSSLVNHAPSAKNNATAALDGPKANVKLAWSNRATSHPEWFDMPIANWAYNYQAGLSFDYVALRDIAAGEEIFVDYGDEWQTAWDEHVADWEPVERLVDSLREDYDSILPTEQEWRWSLGDPNEDSQAVNLWCYNIYRELQGLPDADDEAYPCKVILRQDDVDGSSILYTAEIVDRSQNEDGDVCEETLDEVLWAVPRDAFSYGGLYEVFDTREYAYSDTFRHDLRIPDELMPDAWKNSVSKDHVDVEFVETNA